MAKKSTQAHSAARASLELLYEVSREFAAALDLRTVLHRVLFLSMKHVGASSGSIIVLDESGQPVESAILVHGQPTSHTTRQLRVTYDQGLAGWVARHRQAALVPDTSKDERWLRLPDDDISRSGPKSAVSAPIMARDELVGVITLVHAQPLFFTSDHLALVQALADQAGIGIQNARLYARSQRRAQVMTAVAESAAVITGSLKLEDVLQRIVEQARQALQAEAAALALLQSGEAEAVFAAATLPRLRGRRFPLGRGIVGWVVQSGEGVMLSNAGLDPRFDPEIDHSPVNDSLDCRVVCAPISSDGRVIGALEVVNPAESAAGQEDLIFLSSIASLAGTAIRHAQLFEGLQVAHRRYQELFQITADPILITDRSGRILEANRQAEALLGLAQEELRQRFIEQVHPLDREKLGGDLSRLEVGQAALYEGVLRPVNASPQAPEAAAIPVEVNVLCFRFGDEILLQWFFHDIRERKELDRLREDLTAMIYHDLRSPLTNVASSLSVLATAPEVENDALLQSVVAIAERSVERILRLTNSLLDINRLEAGQPVGTRNLVSPTSLVHEAIEVVRHALQNRSIDLKLALAEDLPLLFVDPEMIRRVLINLLENAIKFSPEKGKIEVGARCREGQVLFWVKDQGPGIPVSERERVFNKFARIEQEHGPRGLGIGLAFCRLAVEGHGGRIWVEGEAGRGSRFCFTLPLASQMISDAPSS